MTSTAKKAMVVGIVLVLSALALGLFVAASPTRGRWEYDVNGSRYYDDDGTLRYSQYMEPEITGRLVKEYFDEHGNLARKEVMDPDTGRVEVFNAAGNKTAGFDANGNSYQIGVHSIGEKLSTTSIRGDGLRIGGSAWTFVVNPDQVRALQRNDKGGYEPKFSLSVTTGDAFFAGDLKVEGTKNAVVETANYGMRTTYADESTDVRFFDRGQGQLVDGQVTVNLDPVFLELVTIDDENPMLVQVTLTSDCNGVFIAEKTGSSFTVKELQGGDSSATFDWEVAAKRKDYEQSRLEVYEQGT